MSLTGSAQTPTWQPADNQHLIQELLRRAGSVLSDGKASSEQLQAAEEAFEVVIARCGANEQAMLGLAGVRLRKGNLGRAEGVLLQCIGAHPHCADAHFYLGLIAEARNNDEQAERCFREALAADPKHTRAAARILASSKDDVYRFLVSQEKNRDTTRAIELLAALRFSCAPRRSAYLLRSFLWILAAALLVAIGSGLLSVVIASILAAVLLLPTVIRQVQSRDFRHLVASMGVPLLGTAVFTYLSSGAPFKAELRVNQPEMAALDACSSKAQQCTVDAMTQRSPCDDAYAACMRDAAGETSRGIHCHVAQVECLGATQSAAFKQENERTSACESNAQACRAAVLAGAARRMNDEFAGRTAGLAYPLGAACLLVAVFVLLMAGRHRRTLEAGRLVYTAGLFANETASVELIRVRDVAIRRDLGHLITGDGALQLYVDRGQGEIERVDLPGIAPYPELAKIMEQVRDLSLLLRTVAGKPVGN